MRLTLQNLFDKDLQKLKEDIIEEQRRRLINNLIPGTKVRTLVAGLGGSGGQILYVIAHVKKGQVTPSHKIFEGSQWERETGKGTWADDYIVLAEEMGPLYDEKGHTRQSSLLKLSEVGYSVEIIHD